MYVHLLGSWFCFFQTFPNPAENVKKTPQANEKARIRAAICVYVVRINIFVAVRIQSSIDYMHL